MNYLFTLISYLPIRVIYASTTLFFYIAYRIVGYRRAIVKDNLCNAFPDWSSDRINETCTEIYKNLAQVCAEIIKLPRMSRHQIESAVELKSDDNMEWCTRPSIVITAHQGNWEWLFQRLVLETQCPAYGIYKPLHNAGVDQFIYKVRTRFGAELVAYKAFDKMALKLRTHSCFMMGDQAPSSHSKVVWLDFFSTRSSFLCRSCALIIYLETSGVLYIIDAYGAR